MSVKNYSELNAEQKFAYEMGYLRALNAALRAEDELERLRERLREREQELLQRERKALKRAVWAEAELERCKTEREG